MMLTNYLNDEWTGRVSSHLQNGQALAKEDLANKLASRVISYVEKRSPFYERHLARRDGPASRYEALTNVPFTTKDDLRQAGMDICALPMSQIATYYETTGTTGAPTPCPRAPIDVKTSGMFVKNATERAYLETFETTQALTAIMGPSELYAFGDSYGDVCRDLGIPFVRLWPESPRVGLDKAADLILKLGVRSLICSPAVALALARLYLSQGIAPDETDVGQVLVLGELCTSEMISNISRLWGANCTHGLYGSQETHAMATGCPQGNLHLSETNYLYEILPVPGVEDGIGEMCVTMLVPGAKPLIRFRTGDLARLDPADSCSCNRGSRVVRVFGRVADLIQLEGRTVMPASIESAILGAIERTWSYEVQICADANGQDRLEVNLIAEIGGSTKPDCEAKIAEKLGVPVTLNFAEALNPRTETGAYVSWKHARIRDERRKQ